MSPALKMYYTGAKMADIAAKFACTTRVITSKLTKERTARNLERREYNSVEMKEFIEDKSLVLALINSGMTQSDIAAKWDVPLPTAHLLITKWLPPQVGKHVTLTGFCEEWQSLPDEFTVMVRSTPMFKVVRIRPGEK